MSDDGKPAKAAALGAAPMADAKYSPLRFAQVRAVPAHGELSYVVIGEWTLPDGKNQWCVETQDDRGDVGDDVCFPTEEDAMKHAEQEYDISRELWVSGGPGGAEKPPKK